jgi:hypothetical protein
MVLAGCTTTAFPRPAEAPALRRLVIMLDGVPHQVMDSLWQAGRFHAFAEPSRMISPFPSLTGVAFRDIWRTPVTNGYEDRYFDRDRNQVAGGFLDHVFNPDEHAGFQRLVDLKPGSFSAGLAYLVPKTMARHELNGLRRKLRERMMWDTLIVAYFVSTDAIAHRAPAELPGFLLEIEQLVTDVRAVIGPQLDIVLFSDHGNDMLPSRRVALESELGDSGFHVSDEIDDPGDVVLPRFGLVGSAFAYTSPGRQAPLATVLRAVKGVDLVAFADSSGRAHVWTAGGRAVIESGPQHQWFRYLALEGDPLGLQPVVARLRASGEADATGAAPDSVWLRETVNTEFVDPLRRIVLGLSAVRNPADVIISLAPGYHFGNENADLFVDVRGTHGSLRTTSSLAFVMGTHVRVPDPIRSTALQRFVSLPGPPVGQPLPGGHPH